MDLSLKDNFQDAVVTVIGLGKYEHSGGFDTVKWLLSHGAQVVITDLKDNQAMRESVDGLMHWFDQYQAAHSSKTLYPPVFALGEHRPDDFTEVDCVIQSPGVPSERSYQKLALENGIALESDVSLFFRYYPQPIIAVTGTRGKTTVSLALQQMLTGIHPTPLLVGNIKTPPLSVLDDLIARNSAQPVVIELSSWLLESLPRAFLDLGKGPEISILTNIYPDHLKLYPDIESYTRSKEIIIGFQQPDQWAVMNYDQPAVRALESRATGKICWFSKTAELEIASSTASTAANSASCFVRAGEIIFKRDGGEWNLGTVDSIALKGVSNLENLLAATAAAMLRGAPVESITRTLKEFVGLPDHQEVIREVREISFVNDTAATSLVATISAVDKFASLEHLILIFQGTSDLASQVKKLNWSQQLKLVIILTSSATPEVMSALNGVVRVAQVPDLAAAVALAALQARSGDTVLYSPGAPAKEGETTFYRGEVYREEVRKL